MSFLRGLAGGLVGGGAMLCLGAAWIGWSPPRVSCADGTVAWTVADTARRIDALKAQSAQAAETMNALLQLQQKGSAAACPPPPACPPPASATAPRPRVAEEKTQATEDEAPDPEAHDIEVNAVSHGIAWLTVDGRAVKVTAGSNLLGEPVKAVEGKTGTVRMAGGREYRLRKARQTD